MKKITLLVFYLALSNWLSTVYAANFSSLTSGNWSAGGTWTLTSGTDADGIPDADDNVTIRFAHIVTLDIAPTIASLAMPNGTLTGSFGIAISGDFTLSRGAFAPEGTATIGGNFLWDSDGDIGVSTSPSVTDVTIGGTTTIDGNITRRLVKRKLILNGGGTWTLGTINVRQGGIFEIGAGQTLNYNSSGGYEIADGGGSGNAFNVKGTLDLQSDGLRIRIPVNNTGAINLSNGNLSFEINSTHSGNGSISVSASRTLTINAVGLDYGNATFANNGTIITNALIFNGSTPQTLSGTGSIANLTVNNANGLVISGTQTISTALTLTNGNIQLSNNDFSLGTATLTGGSSTSFIQTNSTGNLKRTVSTTDVLFPVGESNYTPVTIRQASSSDTYSVRVSDGIDIAHPLMGTQFVAKEWDISRTPSNTIAATVKMEWNSGEEGVGFSCATAQMLHHNGTFWEALPLSGTTVSCGTSPRSITKTGVTAFSPFAVGLPAFVLSAELMGFKAITHKSTIDLLWQTASEKDMSYFDIEQSTDGLNFSKISETKAAGKANNYEFLNYSPLSITTYFRLKIVRSDGRFTYSKVISVAFGKELTVKSFPNPIENELNIETISDAKNVEIDVVDLLGRRVFYQNTEGSNSLKINTLNWQSGIYILTIKDGKNTVQQKVIKR